MAERGLTSRQLSTKARLSEATVSHALAGNFLDAETVRKLASTLAKSRCFRLRASCWMPPVKRRPPRAVPRYQRETELGELRRALVWLVLYRLMELDEWIPLDLDVSRIGNRLAVRDGDRILRILDPAEMRAFHGRSPGQAAGRDITARELSQLVYGAAWYKAHYLHKKSLPKLADEKYGRGWYQGRLTKAGLPVLPPRPIEQETKQERTDRLARTVSIVEDAIRYVEEILGATPAWIRRPPRRRRRS